MSHGTVYAVALKDEGFLMVYNPKRKGWEMPGGHVEKGESSEEAVRREFIEESGYDIEVVKTRDIGHCDVCAAILLDRISDDNEMESKLFSELP